ncbi:MAG TPA: HAD-IIB family hydrolase [Symbiobacteriaceae bacterium]|nr:HAD-IIB family hydrolase [Symbiobacteriaceae bacterium]
MINWRQFRLLAVDMDGTLAGADHRVTPRTIAVLQRAERAGLRVVLVTGRSLPTVLHVWQKAGLSAPVVTFGGGLVLQPPELSVVQAQAIPGEAVAQSLWLGRDLDLMVSLWTREGLWVTRPDHYAVELADITGMPLRILNAVPAEAVLKIGFGAAPARLDAVQDMLISQLGPIVGIARSLPQAVEATALGSSKHHALEAVLKYMGIAPAEVIAAGDGETDVGMLRLAGYAVVPANGMPGPLAVADRVIAHHDREAIAEFLDEVLSA